jgi:hypothetical protein
MSKIKRIGIIGDSYDNDAVPYKILLSKKIKEAEFIPLLPGVKGNNVPKICRMLPTELEKRALDMVICSTDLDALESNIYEIELKTKQWFEPIDKAASHKGVFFLVIAELEAIILADFNTFKKIYKIKSSIKKTPMSYAQPKEELKKLTEKTGKKYHENHAADIFQELDFDIIKNNHHGFSRFIDKLNDEIKK